MKKTLKEQAGDQGISQQTFNRYADESRRTKRREASVTKSPEAPDQGRRRSLLGMASRKKNLKLRTCTNRDHHGTTGLESLARKEISSFPIGTVGRREATLFFIK